jgi:hypothetical protein
MSIINHDNVTEITKIPNMQNNITDCSHNEYYENKGVKKFILINKPRNVRIT